MKTTSVSQSVDWEKVIDTPLPVLKVTDQVREETKRESARFRGNIRLSTGLFYTDQEYADMRSEELKHKMP